MSYSNPNLTLTMTESGKGCLPCLTTLDLDKMSNILHNIDTFISQIHAKDSKTAGPHQTQSTQFKSGPPEGIQGPCLGPCRPHIRGTKQKELQEVSKTTPDSVDENMSKIDQLVPHLTKAVPMVSPLQTMNNMEVDVKTYVKMKNLASAPPTEFMMDENGNIVEITDFSPSTPQSSPSKTRARFNPYSTQSVHKDTPFQNLFAAAVQSKQNKLVTSHYDPKPKNSAALFSTQEQIAGGVEEDGNFELDEVNKILSRVDSLSRDVTSQSIKILSLIHDNSLDTHMLQKEIGHLEHITNKFERTWNSALGSTGSTNSTPHYVDTLNDIKFIPKTILGLKMSISLTEAAKQVINYAKSYLSWANQYMKI